MKQYTVAAVTGTRAEYGLLSPVIQKIQNSEQLCLKLVVTGSHLSDFHGKTVTEIEADGARIDARLPILRFENNALGTAKTIAYAIGLFAEYFAHTKPSAVLVLGDRYEIFAAATAAATLNIPLIHISGGDVTLGAQDEFFRHSITKMAKLHFPACAQSAQRLIAMGEEPSRVFNVGGLGDENIRSMKKMSLQEIEKSIDFTLGRYFALITFHPETGTGVKPAVQMQALLSALQSFPKLTLLFTKANADAGGDAINIMLDEFCAERENAIAVPSLGLKRYLSAMALCKVVIGNSSSGVVETPTFQTPTVNIGNRQSGRQLCANVISCEANKEDIENAVDLALSPQFMEKAKTARSPYNGGATSARIVAIITDWLENNRFDTPKAFYDGGIE